jgi:hypothetical protein
MPGIERVERATRYLRQIRDMELVTLALARGAATSAMRTVDLTAPQTWEFSGFSQNGEDGVIETLLRNLIASNRYFLEIGAADGLENNTSWLSVARRFSGIMIEGDPRKNRRCTQTFTPLNYNVEFLCQLVTPADLGALTKRSLFPDPDVFSVDIDSNDFHLMEAAFWAGLRPKICVVEFNSAFGPEAAITIPYREGLGADPDPANNLYYGCSITAWRRLFARWGYRFVSVESSGVNAIFVDPKTMDPDFISGIRPCKFAENVSQRHRYRTGWLGQWELIRDRSFVEVS